MQPSHYLVSLTFKNMASNLDFGKSHATLTVLGESDLSVVKLRFMIFWPPNTLLWNLEKHKIYNFGPEWGRHGSPRAHTQSQRSRGLQEGF